MTEHLSRHQLERLIANELGTDARPSTRSDLRAQAHVLGCDVCTTRKRSIETARAQFLALRPAAEFAQAVLVRAGNAPEPPVLDSAPRKRALLLGLGGSVLAAAAAMLLWLDSPRAPESSETIRLKGTSSLEVFVKRGELITPIRDGDALAAGDQLGFVYTLSEPRHLLLLGVDERGAITRYYPADGASSAPLAAGARVQLPLGVELDAQRGQERVIAFFAQAPLEEARVRSALLAEVERVRRAGRGLAGIETIDVPAQQKSIWFRKP
jgi:hypothetical protein